MPEFRVTVTLMGSNFTTEAESLDEAMREAKDKNYSSSEAVGIEVRNLETGEAKEWWA